MRIKYHAARLIKITSLIISVALMLWAFIYIFYDWKELIRKIALFDKNTFITIENIRDLCTILGIVLIPAGWIYNEYQQRVQDQYASKERKYQEILRSADVLLYEDFRHPEIQELVHKFIKEFQICYLYVPDNVIRAGHKFLKSFEALLDEPEEILSMELKETLSEDETNEANAVVLENIKKDVIKNQKISYEEYLSNRQKELYSEFRDKKYPKFIEAIRKDMMSRGTTLANDEYIVCIPSHIKIKRHLEFVGKGISHLIVLLVEAKKEKDVEKLNKVLLKIVKSLRPHFKDIGYGIEKDNKIVIFLGDKKYNIITFLDKLSINKIMGFEKALEMKVTLENT